MLKFEHANIGYEDTCVIKDFNLQLKYGQKVCIVGPSGSGKTTLLKMIWSEAKLLGGEFTNTYQDMSVIFQQDGLFEWLTVYDNIKVTLPNAKDEQINLLATNLGIENLLNRYSSKLSGGQKQRVQILRALLANSELLIVDEPTSSLDMINKELFVELLLANLDSNTSIILVTHDLEEAALLADQIFVLKDGEIKDQIENIEACERYLGSESLNSIVNQVREVIRSESN